MNQYVQVGGISDMCLGFLLTSDEHFDGTDDTSFTFMHLPSNSGGGKIRSMAITNGNNTGNKKNGDIHICSCMVFHCDIHKQKHLINFSCLKMNVSSILIFSFIHFEPIVGANSVSVTAVII